MPKSIFIDTTVCTACRGCQVACKQWHDLPAEKTKNRGRVQNPPDLSFETYKLVRMNEQVIDDRLRWLFFPEQCRHCVEAPCLETASDESAIYQDAATGAILYTLESKALNADEILEACPYNIPRKADDGTLAKCDLCNDRVHNGLKPACVSVCPTGAMAFGDRQDMLASAKKRLHSVMAKYPKAQLLDPEEVNVIYLVAHEPKLYAENAVASNARGGPSRGLALRKIFNGRIRRG